MQKDFVRNIVVLAFSGALSSTLLYAGGMGPVNQAHDWTGFYIGANSSAQWASFSGVVSVDTLVIGANIIGPSVQFYKEALTSFTGGGQIGYKGVEGRYTDYGTQHFNLVPVPIVVASTGQALFSPSTARLDTSTEEVIVKINYQFS